MRAFSAKDTGACAAVASPHGGNWTGEQDCHRLGEGAKGFEEDWAMTLAKSAVVQLIFALLVCLPAQADAVSEATARCDALGASPEDATRPAGVQGIEADALDTEAAIAACEAALRLAPGNHRLEYQLARALQAGGKDLTRAFDLYMLSANSGHAGAMHNLGAAYQRGDGVEPDVVEAMRWYRRAAEPPNNFRMAKVNLGLLYQSGSGVEADPTQAAKLFCDAAAAGLPEAMTRCGFAYNKGEGVVENARTAVSWYRKAAKLGNGTSQRNLGICYRDGYGVEQDYAQALDWLRKAAAQDLPDAKATLGGMYEEGLGVPASDSEAEKLYRSAAEYGDADGQNGLARLYESGRALPQDYTAAWAWYQKAADQNHPAALNNLGFLYDQANGVGQDRVKAFELYQRSAALGNEDAMNNVAESLIWGEGTEKNAASGIEWSRKAVKAGSSRAAFNLGRYYDEGKIIEHDPVKAADLFFSSLADGFEDAVKMFVDERGGEAAPDTLDALQNKLAANGAEFARAKGKLTESGAAAIKALAEE
jgi:TPR repeat protein